MTTVKISLRDARQAQEVFRDLGITELQTVSQVATDTYEFEGGEHEEEDIQEWFIEAIGMFGLEGRVQQGRSILYNTIF